MTTAMSNLNPTTHVYAFREIVRLLTKHRQLTWEMTKREISDRYAGQAIGTLWAAGHPLAQMLVYIFIFAFVFKARIGGAHGTPGDYIIYFLSGLIPWIAFQESLAKGSMVIVSNSAIVKQVVFPIEVLPVKGVLASMITQLLSSAVFIGYVIIRREGLSWTFALLPLLWTAQFLAMSGVSYVLSSIGAYFRDIKDVVQLSGLLGMYLVPIAYLPEWVPEWIRPLYWLNPFSYMAWCYQDACYYGRFEHPWAWVVFPLGSLAVFYLGYRVFKKLKTQFGNVL
jgi:lipopolysaccharide transport system permease protein